MAIENEKCERYGLHHDKGIPCYFCKLDKLSKQDIYEELLDLKRCIREFSNYLVKEQDEYAENNSAINIELSVIWDVMDKFDKIFSERDY